MVYYHNPRCSKSRQGLEILEKSGAKYIVKDYLKEPLTVEELDNLLNKLSLSPEEVVRKKEEIFKELHLENKKITRSEWIDIIIKYPKLLERPILLTKEAAVIGRPPEKLHKLLGI